MPLFDYTCCKCSKTVEKLTKGEEVIHCECGYTMHKQISTGTNFTLQGMYWEKPGFSH